MWAPVDLDKYLQTLGDSIQGRLDHIERDQAWLARQTKMTPAGINRIMNKVTKDPHLSTIAKIAEALDCGPGDLLKEPPAAGNKKAQLLALISGLSDDMVTDLVDIIPDRFKTAVNKNKSASS